MIFFKRKKQKKSKQEPRPLLTGTVTVGDRDWTLREEKRSGPWPQLLVLVAVDDERSEMHVRPNPGQEARSFDEVADLASDPLYRWFTDPDGNRWETRIVYPDPPDRLEIKFISWTQGVFEGDFPHTKGLGVVSDAQLSDLLRALRNGAP